MAISKLRRALLSLISAAVLTGSALAADAPKRRVLAADYSTNRIAIVDADGKIEWEHKTGNIHDLHALPSGNILFQTSMQHLIEVDPKTNKTLWEYDAGKSNGNAGKPVEVHAFQRLADGNTMVVESGPARIIEVDPSGKLVKEVKLTVKNPSTHSDTRLARKLENGHYLVTHERDGTIREYDDAGKVVWEYPVPMFEKKSAGGHGPEGYGNSAFSAVRLPNGNTLIGTGNGHSVIEVTPDKKIVWEIHQKDLPDITLAWVTTLQVLPNGNIVIGNCHATKANPQIVEVSRDKKVVWTFKDFEKFADALSNSQVLDEPKSIR